MATWTSSDQRTTPRRSVPSINVVSPEKKGSPLPPRSYRLAESPTVFFERHKATLTEATTKPSQSVAMEDGTAKALASDGSEVTSISLKELELALGTVSSTVHFDILPKPDQGATEGSLLGGCIKNPRAMFKASGRKATPHPVKRHTISDDEDGNAIQDDDINDIESDDDTEDNSGSYEQSVDALEQDGEGEGQSNCLSKIAL